MALTKQFLGCPSTKKYGYPSTIDFYGWPQNLLMNGPSHRNLTHCPKLKIFPETLHKMLNNASFGIKTKQKEEEKKTDF